MNGAAGTSWAAYLPLLIFAGVMAWRFRTVDTARPLWLPVLWIMPLLVTSAVSLALYGMPPSATGWLALACGLMVGALIGAQRSRMMRLHVEGDGDAARVMVRQSPMTLVLILAVFAVRRFVLPTGGLSAGHNSTTALILTDATLGFVLGLVVASRLVLWIRAKDMVARHVTDT